MFTVLSFCHCRIHPLNVLLALKAYEKGKPANSTKTQWKVNAAVVTALDCAFYKSFTVIEHRGISAVGVIVHLMTNYPQCLETVSLSKMYFTSDCRQQLNVLRSSFFALIFVLSVV